MVDTSTTLFQMLEQYAQETPDATAYVEMNLDDSWDEMTWKEVLADVRAIAKGLIALGLDPGECVALVGDNRRDWVLCQHAISAAGGASASIYTTNTVEQTAFIVKNCGAKIAICDKADQLEKYRDAMDRGLMQVDHIVTMDTISSDGDLVTSLDAVRATGRKASDAELDKRLAAVKPDDLTMLIYTSGTTGLPKGAMYTHANIDSVGAMLAEALHELADVEEKRYISYLPLCHAAEQALTNFMGLRIKSVIYFCPDVTRLADTLKAARPTLFFAVPRVWEKFEAALRGKFAQATGLKAKLAAWATKKELDCFNAEIETGEEVWPFGRKLANKLVISKIKAAMGLDELVAAGSGAAPISRSTLDFFASIGVPITEAWGMTETTAVASVNPIRRPRFGTVGKPLPRVDVTIAKDGEVLLKGANMVSGYWHLPDKTAALIDSDGWLHTGDLGTLEDGFLSIVGRKKDLLITAGGKNVAPSEIESLLQGLPGVGQAVVVGDRKPYLCALLVLDPEAIPELCKAADISEAPIAELAAADSVRAFYEQWVEDECNASLARYQTIKKFRILPQPFSVDTGELTPTMKVKRNVVNDEYADVIASMYL